MASALIAGLCPAKYQPTEVWVSDPYEPAVARLKAAGYNATAQNKLVCGNCDVIFLCTKPGSVASVLTDLGAALANKILVSICAGVTLDALEASAHKTTRVIRVMPNTPCLVGQCASAYSLGSCAKVEVRDDLTI